MDCRRCDERLDDIKAAQMRAYKAEMDYHEMVNQNSRIVLWCGRRGVKLPSTGELEQLFPLEHRAAFQPKRPK